MAGPGAAQASCSSREPRHRPGVAPARAPAGRANRSRPAAVRPRGSWLLALLLLLSSGAGGGADFAHRDFATLDGGLLRLVGVANRTGDRVRLTRAAPGVAGAVWALTKQYVEGGFTSTFRIVADPEQAGLPPCPVADVASTGAACGRRGDGFAFVLQNGPGDRALGGAGAGLGYAGLHNAIAIEFDSWFDAEADDPFEAHLAVLAPGPAGIGGGSAAPGAGVLDPAAALAGGAAEQSAAPGAGSGGMLGSGHARQLGAVLDLPDLLDGNPHDIQLAYDPEFDPAALRSPSFRAAPHAGALAWPRGRAWRHGLGMLRVFVDDLAEPVLTVPINLGATLALDQGRAWVGITASTGVAFCLHELLAWSFKESLSDAAAIGARAGANLGPGQVPPPGLVGRWLDPVFARLHTPATDVPAQPPSGVMVNGP